MPTQPSDRTNRDLNAANIRAAIKEHAADPIGDFTLTDKRAGRGEGRLTLRFKSGTATWRFRYTRPSGQRDYIAFGTLARGDAARGESAGAVFTEAQARAKAREFSALLRDPATADIREHIEEQKRQAQADIERRRAERIEAERNTLQALMEVYVEHLQNSGKSSAQSVRNAVRLHLTKSRPKLASTPAKAVTSRELASVVRELVEDGKERIAGLMRSYFAAAYNLALRAETDPSAPAAMLIFNISTNPAERIGTVEVKARDRLLTDAELLAVLNELRLATALGAKAMLLALLLGGQRPLQVARVRLSEWNPETGVLTLWDGKGKRKRPRKHLLPVLDEAASVLNDLSRIERSKGDYLFSNDGSSPIGPHTISRFMTELSVRLVDNGTASEPFQGRDLRRTAEQKMKYVLRVSKDMRAVIQSHGMGGVQDKHYDGDDEDSLAEKRRVQVAWAEYLRSLSDTSSKVTPMRKALP